jgi:hypothetical protein
MSADQKTPPSVSATEFSSLDDFAVDGFSAPLSADERYPDSPTLAISVWGAEPSV